MSEFWFARRFAVGNPRNAVAPVSREGRMVFVYWVIAMVVGAAAWLFLTVNGLFLGGVIVFVAVTILATWLLFMAVVRKSDQTRTVEDYRRMGGGRT